MDEVRPGQRAGENHKVDMKDAGAEERCVYQG